MLIDQNVNLFKEIFYCVWNVLDNSNGGKNCLLLDVRRLMSHEFLYLLIQLSAHFFSRDLSDGGQAKYNVKVIRHTVKVLLDCIGNHHQQISRL